MFNRECKPLLSHSFFLFGARGTGKTTLLSHYLPTDRTYTFDLLNSDTFLELSREPNRFYESVHALAGQYEWFVLDEVQKLPFLLDSVHRLIFEQVGKFAITGSSARKLRRGGANLLAGRALLNYLYPLSITELDSAFTLEAALSWGTLPAVCLAKPDEKKSLLSAYVHTYLREEIAAEQVVRRLEPFRQFLMVAADSIGKILNYANVSKDVGISNLTAQSYFQILEDTLIGFFLQPYHRSVRKRQRLNPKFYLFDCGITRALTGTTSSVTSPKLAEYGHLFEQFVICEIFKAQSYRSSEVFNYYLTTHDGSEIDLIIEQPQRKTLLIEIKSSKKVLNKELTVLEKFRDDFYKPELMCISQEPRARQVGNVTVLPVVEGIARVIGSL